MAKTNAVWGIDLGQCALKAMRCTLVDGEVVADAHDFIEYPKILSQPESEPEQLVAEALELFLSRNNLKQAKVAISLPGQSGLARFFKPPPVEPKKLPDIVKYEARQQIPFPLEEVIWDYQKMAGGVEVEGITLDAEVGLFAMKREQVHRLIAPFVKAGIELDIVQLAPFSVYNFVSHDVIDIAPEFDPQDPPESVVVLSIGTDTTDLVVTNGFRVWQRSVPIGGNHFTKQLTRELKLTFAKAEHVKRNAKQAEDPKAVFQAMRPVFNDLVTEVQRSVGYFQSIDRKAKIGGVVVLGNTVKLPGLQEYLAKNLGYEVVRFKGFQRLKGEEVLKAPAFQDNELAFGVAYGLCLQGLGVSRLRTNLIPRQILTERLIRAKKPWVVAAISALCFACAVQVVCAQRQNHYVQPETRDSTGVAWSAAESAVSSLKTESDGAKSAHDKLLAQLKLVTEIGKEVVGSNDRRVLWLELQRVLLDSLPRTEGIEPGSVPDPKQFPYDQRREIYVTEVESEYFEDLATWYTEDVKKIYADSERSNAELWTHEGSESAEGADGATPATPAPATPAAGATATADPGPKGPGFVIQLTCHHYFNRDKTISGTPYARMTLIRNLQEGKLRLPKDPSKYDPTDPSTTEEFTLKELGLGYVLILPGDTLNREYMMPNPEYVSTGPGGGAGEMPGFGPGFGAGPPGLGPAGLGPATGFGPGAGGGSGPAGAAGAAGQTDTIPSRINVPRCDFIVQFAWQQNRLSDRLEEHRKAREAAEEAAKQQAEQDQAAGGATAPATGS